MKDVTDTSALVSWSQPVAPVERIAMFYGPTSDASDETVVMISPPDKQYSIDGLIPDKEYKVSLISRNGDISSDPVTATFTTGMLVVSATVDFILSKIMTNQQATLLLEVTFLGYDEHMDCFVFVSPTHIVLLLHLIWSTKCVLIHRKASTNAHFTNIMGAFL